MERRRLESWKEIASHLGRAVRTVQRWEKEANLPVYRLPGGGLERVFAYTDELDEWMHTAKPGGNGNGGHPPAHPAGTEQAPLSPAEASPNGSDALYRTDPPDPTDQTDRSQQPGTVPPRWLPRLPRPWKTGLAVAALVVIVSGGFLFWRTGGHPAGAASAGPAVDSLRMESRTLAALDAAGSILWQRRFPAPLVLAPDVPNENPMLREARMQAMEDLDGNGRREILVVTGSDSDGRGSWTLHALSEDGRELWAFQPARPWKVGKERFDASWTILYFLIDDLDGDGRREILLNACHSNRHLACLFVLDSSGQAVAEYPHNGPLAILTAYDLNDDGWKELLAGGTSRELHLGCFMVLDSRRLPREQREESVFATQAANGPAGREIAYLLFPQHCLAAATLPAGVVPDIRVTSDAVIVGTESAPRPPCSVPGGLIYTFNHRLELQRVETNSGYQVQHRCLEEQGWLDHSYSDAELDRFRRVLYWDGAKFSEQPSVRW